MATNASKCYFQSARPVAQAGFRDPNLVSPLSGNDLSFMNGALTTLDGEEAYSIDDGILRLFKEEDLDDVRSRKRDAVTRTVQDFYEGAPFPNYNDFDTLESFLHRAVEGVFANLLRAQIPINAKVLEVGCGTGQLSNYLAATTMAHVYAADISVASLKLGQKFAAKHDIPGITYMHMNLFRPAIRPGSMDIVISNGVLHHTADTLRAFLSIAELVKPGGHIIIGLYNRLGRVRTNLRRTLYRVFGTPVLALDPQLRGALAPEKRRAWINDQYAHPHERKHSMSEVLDWFEQAGFNFVSSIPKIRGHFTPREQLFVAQNPGSPTDRLAAELTMIFTHGGEGGLFIMIGQRR